MVEHQSLKDGSVRPKPVLQRDISQAFFRIGMLGFGGGPSSIPLVHQEVVKKYKWMDEEEFGDTLALANTMPGPIATKMAGYIGYRIAGFWGCVNALLASVLPTVVLMILLLGFLQSFKDSPRVQGMTAAVIPVVAVMLALMTWDFIKKSGETLGWWKACLIIAGAAFLMELLHIHPAIIILVCMAIAFFPLLKRRGRK
ncbi:chromate transporter [Psychrobacillus sp. FSL W7-1457]|uniref:chromate transporter n=1 Tax=Psychrobacillus sp. FSL W7-1457 TaxID=2954547 RepID=UPI003159AD12